MLDLAQRHIGWPGHQALGDMISIYIREQVCETKRRLVSPTPEVDPSHLWPKGDELGVVPRLHLWEKVQPQTYREEPGLISRLATFQFDTERKVPPVDPSCFFTSSDTRPLRPTAFEGDWHIEKWNDKAA